MRKWIFLLNRIFTYPPHTFHTKTTFDRFLLSLWTFQSSLQPVPTSLLAEPSSWPDALLMSPTAPALNKLHTTLFTLAFHLLSNLLFNFHFHCIQLPQILPLNSPHTITTPKWWLPPKTASLCSSRMVTNAPSYTMVSSALKSSMTS